MKRWIDDTLQWKTCSLWIIIVIVIVIIIIIIIIIIPNPEIQKFEESTETYSFTGW